MINEKQINSWKHKLNDLSALPGEDPCSLEKSWIKLETRLHTKKEKKQSPWYWVAAAVVLLFVTVSIIQDDKTEDSEAGIVKSNKTTTTEKTRHATTPENNAAIVTAPMPRGEKQVRHLAKKSRLSYSLPAINDSAFAVQIIPIETDSVDNMAAIPESIKERPVFFTSLKKKLPVVHVNELEKPLPTIEAVAGNDNRPGPRIRFFTRDASTVSPVSNDADNNIITIKLPPLN